MKKVSLLLLVLVNGFALQSYAQKVFYGAGFIAGLSHTVPKTYTMSSGIETTPSVRTFVYGAGVCLDAQWLPLADEMSIGLHAEAGFAYSIAFSTGMEDAAFLIQSPLMVQFNYGNYSSINSEKEVGFGIGLGALTQYHYLFRDYQPEESFGKSFVFLPAVQASIRFWSKSNSLYVLRLTHAIGSEQFGGADNNRASSFLSISRIINY